MREFLVTGAYAHYFWECRMLTCFGVPQLIVQFNKKRWPTRPRLQESAQ